MASTKIAFYIYYLLIISPGIHVYVYYMIFAKLLKLLKKNSQWHPGHVPYLPSPRYATAHQYFVTVEQLTTLVVIGTDCTGSYKSNYYTIMTITASYINCNGNPPPPT
jgi:hypothetical protein